MTDYRAGRFDFRWGVTEAPAWAEDQKSSETVIQTGMGICRSSQQQELAWEFIRQALTAEYQRALAERWYLSVRGDIMEAQLQGEIVPLLPEDEENEALDEAVAEQYRRLVSQPLVFIGYNEELSGIILEEGEAYFTGQRTVEEAAERIQNRVTLYLSEIQ